MTIEVKRYQCLLCGRNKFTKRTPHNCKGGYRKRRIAWKEITPEPITVKIKEDE